MSDSDDHGPDVDDMLEAAYGGGNNESETAVSLDGKAGSASRRVQGENGASPEASRKDGRRSSSTEKKRRRSVSRSRSPSPKSSRKKKRSSSRDGRRRDRSVSNPRVRRSSPDRRPSPDDSDGEGDRDRRKRRDKQRRSKSRSSSGSHSRDRRREVRRRRDSPASPRRRSRTRSRERYDNRRDRYDSRRDDSNGYRGRGGYGGRRSPPPFRGGGGYGGGYGRGGGRPRQSVERARSVRSESPSLPAEERDQRTVFAMQLAQTINAKDLEKFFSSVGKVRDVRLIVDSKTRRSKGIAYIEFYELEAVPLALGLHGQKLKNCPMIIQPTHAEKNRAAMAAAGAVQKGPMRLYVGSLHFNITEDMLKDIFEPFGKIDSLQLMMDTETARSRGYAFITFRDVADAKRAMEQLNGFELAGRAMKIGHVTDRSESGGQSLDNDDMDRVGFDLGPTGRLQLMAKLAEGTGMKIPQATVQPIIPVAPMAPIATQCFMLSNMFDPSTETEPDWDKELTQEIVDECSQYGGVVHVKVDKASAEGNVYVKSVSISAAAMAVQHLHGRFFAGKMITANYIPTMNYHQLFPSAMKSHQPLAPVSIT